MTTKRKYSIDNDKGTFTKYYFSDNEKNNINLEYEKGLNLCKIINYPAPLKITENSITYQLIDVEYPLAQAIRKINFDYEHLRTVGKELKKMHDHGYIHGDFSPSNVLITKNSGIYFIDASFSEPTSGGKVFFKSNDIYQDISLFLFMFKISMPLYKPWLYVMLIFGRNRKMRAAFIEGYFKNVKDFDEYKNNEREIFFLERCLEWYGKKEPGALNLIHLMYLRFLKFLM